MKNNTSSSSSSSSLCSQVFSVPSLFVSFSLLFALPLALFYFLFASSSSSSFSGSRNALLPEPSQPRIRVHVAELPRSLNYGLLESYWSSGSDSRLGSDDDDRIRSRPKPETLNPKSNPPYPQSPLIKQYSAEYWILGDLDTPPEQRSASFAERVAAGDDYDVVFVPFFATLSAEIQLGRGKSVFRKKVASNEDYQRQRQVVDFVKNSRAWKLSGGRDHVFVLTGTLIIFLSSS